ncbi:uncharacterized protein BT62DRAFT_923000 [Guyanagaster necrorhizus]|uniref:Uncharacterized protein n=1 Tax=Guyanagaster necrorhizus TaxID=856835 RepID=A0A9P8APL6_9AGAR|nr:uncharacterized protein BT62DRAFT_923000 [Guyanagaster necrorhizus MCA 3950]KAG7441997.1 hypothetical protein BT62DRAFT_923000 [Guyanagaster necrorhizus MCA 3950]
MVAWTFIMYWLWLILLPMLFLSDGIIIVKENGRSGGVMRLAAKSGGLGSSSHPRGIERVPGMVGNPMGSGGRREIRGGGLFKEVFWEVMVLTMEDCVWYKDPIVS